MNPQPQLSSGPATGDPPGNRVLQFPLQVTNPARPCAIAILEYLREDLEALDHPNRQDPGIILGDLRISFGAYWHTVKKDWTGKE